MNKRKDMLKRAFEAGMNRCGWAEDKSQPDFDEWYKEYEAKRKEQQGRVDMGRPHG